MKRSQRILVLGVGNVLLSDEGAGVHAVRWLEERYRFPGHVRLLDGGTLGLLLMDELLAAQRLIVIDAVRGGQAPGSVYRLEKEGLRRGLGFSDSLHQLDLLDALNLHAMSGAAIPEIVVFGLEPENISALSPALGAACRAALPKLCRMVINELRSFGCQAAEKRMD
ncbi:MAG: hydrogenase maturation protease [Deltaproteobacteria bacterium]|nr:hydrogenase maturation protease [Deltaproteobacteria bacterium]